MPVVNLSLAARSPARRLRASLAMLACLCLLPAGAQTLVPGKMPGEFSVSPSGSANYSIPIQVPPGVAGLEPKFALGYNSQGGNGIMGMGWGIEGISAITRCPRTQATDGVFGSVNHNANDRFCLDGQRLMSAGGVYGAPASEYRTEFDSFSRVIANGVAAGSSANGPESFTVRTKAGLTMQYGYTTDSRIEAQGKSAVDMWLLNKMSDVHGNAVEFAYLEDNASGSWRLVSSSYAGRSVHFIYEARPDIAWGFQAGSKSSRPVRLKEVETRIGSNTVQRTKVTYSANSSELGSVVEKVQLCDGAGRCMKEMTAGYPAAPVQRLLPYPAFPENGYGVGVNNYNYKGGDFNGDGKSDLIHFVSNDYVHVWLAKGDGTFDIKGRFPAANGYPVAANTYNYTPGDFNGDGRTDLLHLTGPDGARVWMSNGDGTFDIKPIYKPWAGYAIPGSGVYQYQSGDFNGDGRTDLIHFVGNAYVNIWFSNGDGTFSVIGGFLPWSGYSLSANNYNYKLGDFNGDGLTDMIHFYSAAYAHVWLSKGDGTFEVKSRFPSVTGYGVGEPNQTYNYQLGDFNGDGKDDLIHFANQSYIHIWFSQGDGTFAVTGQYKPWAGYYVAANNYKYEVGDYNGDGKSDLLHFVENSNINIWLSKGDGAFLVSGNAHQWPAYPVGANNYNYQTGDYNGDGKTDLIHFIRSTAVHVWHSQYSHYSPINSVAVGAMQANISYQSLSGVGASSVYTKDVGAVYPLADVQAPINVVRAVSQSNGVGGANSSTYSYGGMKEEQASGPGRGRGNLGFRWMKVKDEATGIETYTEYAQTWPYVGQAVKSETRLANAGNAGVLKRTEGQLDCYQTLGANPTVGCPAGVTGLVYHVFPAKTTESSWDFNGTTLPVVETIRALSGTALADGSIKQMGDVTYLQVNTLQDGVLKHSKTTVNEYHPAKTTGADWQIGRLKKATVVNTTPLPANLRAPN